MGKNVTKYCFLCAFQDEGGEAAPPYCENLSFSGGSSYGIGHFSPEENSRDSSQPTTSSSSSHEDICASDSSSDSVYYSSSDSSSSEHSESSNFSHTHEDKVKKLKEKYSLDDKLTMVDSKRLTKIECLVVLISFARRHGLNDTALEDLTKLVNFILGHNCIPEPVNIINEIFSNDFGVDVHYYCCKCESYIGKESDLIAQNQEQDPKRDVTVECSVNLCGAECNVSKKKRRSFLHSRPIAAPVAMFSRIEVKCHGIIILSRDKESV